MKIDSYTIGMDSARTYSSSSTRKLAIGITRQNYENSLSDFSGAFTGASGTNTKTDDNDATGDKTSDSSTSLKDMIDSMQSPLSNRIRQVENNNTLRQVEDVHQKFVVYLWRLLFGRKEADNLAKEFGFPTDAAEYSGTAGTSTITIQGFRESYFEENEAVSFTSTGSVTTSDGRTINFNLDVEMSRSFSQYIREDAVAIGDMIDPLVINFDGNPAELSDTKFYFDLDNDGTEEAISRLSSNTGFLALDKNDDGIINNGSELFGTSSGNGFADLAEYDTDHNGWIDENDDIYNQLKIWVKDNTGYDKLYSLKEKNIGAIYLGNVDTNYTLRSGQTADVNGAIRKTGIFLYEDGTGVGTINHLDIAN